MIVDFDILRDSSSPLHDPDSLIVVSVAVPHKHRKEECMENLLVTDFQFSPLAPNFGKILDGLEVDLSTLFQDFTGTIEICLCLPSDAALLVELREVDIQSVQIRCSLPRHNCRQCFCVCLGHLTLSRCTISDEQKYTTAENVPSRHPRPTRQLSFPTPAHHSGSV